MDAMSNSSPRSNEVSSQAPQPQPAPQDSHPQSPTGLSLRESPKLLAFAGLLTLISAIFFKNFAFQLDAPSMALVAAAWLMVGLVIRRILERLRSAGNRRH